MAATRSSLLKDDPSLKDCGPFDGAGNRLAPFESFRGGDDNVLRYRVIAEQLSDFKLGLRLRSAIRHDDQQVHVAVRSGAAGCVRSELNSNAKLEKRSVYWADLKRAVATPVFDGALLVPGNRIKGPAVIETTDTTVAVPPRCVLKVDRFGNFEIDFQARLTRS